MHRPIRRTSLRIPRDSTWGWATMTCALVPLKPNELTPPTRSPILLLAARPRAPPAPAMATPPSRYAGSASENADGAGSARTARPAPASSARRHPQPSPSARNSSLRSPQPAAGCVAQIPHSAPQSQSDRPGASRPVRLDIADLLRLQLAIGQCPPDDPLLRRPVRHSQAAARTVLVDGRAVNHGHDAVAVGVRRQTVASGARSRILPRGRNHRLRRQRSCSVLRPRA